MFWTKNEGNSRFECICIEEMIEAVYSWLLGEMAKKKPTESPDALISAVVRSNKWQSAAFPFIHELRNDGKLLNRNLPFKSALLIPTLSTNALHSTDLLWWFSPYHVPTNSVAPSFCM